MTLMATRTSLRPKERKLLCFVHCDAAIAQLMDEHPNARKQSFHWVLLLALRMLGVRQEPSLR